MDATERRRAKATPLVQRCKRASQELREQLAVCREAWIATGNAADRALQSRGSTVSKADVATKVGGDHHLQDEQMWAELKSLVQGLSEECPRWAPRILSIVKWLEARHAACRRQRDALLEANAAQQQVERGKPNTHQGARSHPLAAGVDAAGSPLAGGAAAREEEDRETATSSSASSSEDSTSTPGAPAANPPATVAERSAEASVILAAGTDKDCQAEFSNHAPLAASTLSGTPPPSIALTGALPSPLGGGVAAPPPHAAGALPPERPVPPVRSPRGLAGLALAQAQAQVQVPAIAALSTTSPKTQESSFEASMGASMGGAAPGAPAASSSSSTTHVGGGSSSSLPGPGGVVWPPATTLYTPRNTVVHSRNPPATPEEGGDGRDGSLLDALGSSSSRLHSTNPRTPRQKPIGRVSGAAPVRNQNSRAHGGLSNGRGSLRYPPNNLQRSFGVQRMASATFVQPPPTSLSVAHAMGAQSPRPMSALNAMGTGKRGIALRMPSHSASPRRGAGRPPHPVQWAGSGSLRGGPMPGGLAPRTSVERSRPSVGAGTASGIIPTHGSGMASMQPPADPANSMRHASSGPATSSSNAPGGGGGSASSGIFSSMNGAAPATGPPHRGPASAAPGSGSTAGGVAPGAPMMPKLPPNNGLVTSPRSHHNVSLHASGSLSGQKPALSSWR